MKYANIVKGIFIKRINRFIAEVNINGHTETVHVKNTGRCAELLIEGAVVYLTAPASVNRKTKYDLIAVAKTYENGDITLINIDSFAPNNAAEEWLKQSAYFGKDAKIKREVRYNNSRFDFYIENGERKIFLEVKGCTLENNGIAYFPDAPTERGIKHINELIDCIKDGYEAYILFVIQIYNIKYFSPNNFTHPAFGEALKKADHEGVNILARNCIIFPDEVLIADDVKIIL